MNLPIVEHTNFTAVANDVPPPSGASLTGLVKVDLAFRSQRWILEVHHMCECTKSVGVRGLSLFYRFLYYGRLDTTTVTG